MVKTILASIFIVVLSTITFYMLFSFGSTYLRNSAIDDCAHASKNVYSEEGDSYTRVIEVPDKTAYEACLAFKKIN